ncbi:MAG: hypothetical protein IKZ47_04420 [Clostridia bacterium]|nr:hypothetical protein [Clostridia bacterium]
MPEGKIPNNNFDDFKAVSEAFGKIALAVAKTLNESAPAIHKAVEMVQESLSGLSNALAKAIQVVKDSTPSKEEIQRLSEIYEQWGKYGWTIHPLAPIDYYDSCPDNHIDADRYALKICTKENTIALLNMLRKQDLPKKDFEEAVVCYSNRCYKSCAMMLYSIIDGKIIKLQKYFGENTDHLIVCGKKGISFLKKKVNEKTNINNTVFFILYYSCLINCLSVFFEEGYNFTLKTNIANRNLIDHGMTNRPVRRKDCLKLFLLLYNLTELINGLKTEESKCQ